MVLGKGKDNWKEPAKAAHKETKHCDDRISRMLHEDDIVKVISKTEEMSIVIGVGLRKDRNRQLREFEPCEGGWSHALKNDSQPPIVAHLCCVTVEMEWHHYEVLQHRHLSIENRQELRAMCC